MLKILNEAYERQKLYKYTVNLAQLASIEEAELIEGRSKGLRVYRFHSANGLAFDLLPGKCLDIGSLSYKGINISLLTRNGLCSPENMVPAHGEFERYFSGGMLWTCGLKNVGPCYTDDDLRFQPFHGRLGMYPSEQSWKKCYFEDDEYYLTAGAILRDTIIEGHNLQLTREISTNLSTPEIRIRDTIENLDINETLYLLLYHFNFGFPFLTPGLKITFPESRMPIIPGNTVSKAEIENFQEISPPIDNAIENLFFHTPIPDSNDQVTVTLQNSQLGIGVVIKYNSEYLPYLVQWKCMRAGEYALGVEPSNSFIGGMPAEKDAGRGKTIQPFEKHEIELTLRFFQL
jgi:hypothetical protein